jgi:hypothetical protein
MLTMDRFKVIAMFLIAVLAATIFWNFLLRGFLAHFADQPWAQGLAGVSS